MMREVIYLVFSRRGLKGTLRSYLARDFRRSRRTTLKVSISMESSGAIWNYPRKMATGLTYLFLNFL